MDSHHDRTATIVGAGIGGLATAASLAATGWRVEVLERAAVLDGGGAGLVLAPNAVRALRALGVAERVMAGATVLQGTGLRTPSGRWLSRALGAAAPGAGDDPVLGVVRSQLVAALAEAAGRDTIRPASPVEDPRSLRADLVVGADGIGSLVRRTWWPGASVRYAGYTAWRALLPSGPLGPGPAVATETWGRGERFGIVPVGSGQLYVYATARVPVGSGAGDDLAELRRRFGHWHHPIPQLLEALEGADVLRHDVHALDLPATLHQPGTPAVVLVGDAGHAMEPNLGQGAGTALEDAVELAHWLGDGTLPTAEALARYSRSRRPRVSALARRSRQVGRVAQARQPVLAAARDVVAALTPERVARRAAASSSDWHPPRPLTEETA